MFTKTIKKYKKYIKNNKQVSLKKLKKKYILRETKQNRVMSGGIRYNEDFIKVLGELHNIMMSKGEPFRARAYKNAETTIVNFPDTITDPKKQLNGLPGIGATILNKLEEYKETGTISILEKERNNPANILAEIYGVGPKKAKELVAAGITSIAKLRENTKELNDKQKIGLKYYEDIQKRIPRKEIEEFDQLFNKIFKSVTPEGSKFEIVGSYRRGAKNSGDIDIIITNNENNKMAFDKVLDVLIKDNIITEVLSRGKTKSLTLVQIKKDGPIRRVDFLYSSPEEYAFTLLYFTGSKIFNTIVRQRALKLGYTLNEHSLSYFTKGVKGQKVEHEFPSEKSILNFLGIKYQNPEDRIDGRSVILLDSKDKPEEISITKISTPLDSDEELEAIAALDALNKSEKELTPLDSDEELEALEALELNEPKIKKTIKIKKNLTLKKTQTISANDLIEKFKTDGISALKLMTETELSKIIQSANIGYYCDDKPILTDTLYDIIREYTLEKYPKNEAANEGHTKCDLDVSKTKVKLPYELWSMDKIKPTTDALKKWIKTYKGPYVISAKLDGISALYVSEKDKPPKLYTRGNGRYGQDISQLIPYLIRKEVNHIAMRGEIIIKKDLFDKKYSKKYSNPRNFVAGVVNKKTIDPDVLNDLDFVAYELIEPQLRPAQQLFEFDVKEIKHVKFNIKENISNEILSDLLLKWRKDYEYEIDGIIVVNDEIYPRPTKNPDYAIAFKMVISDQVAEAKVVDVLWSASKDGYLKPRVQIEPINLGGAKIEFATGFNAKFIVENKIGIGAVITIIRSGDVIPHIVSVVVPAEKPLLPTEAYKWNDTHVDIILDNKEDDATVKEKNIVGFFKGIEVDGLGPGNVKKLIETGYDSVPIIIGLTKDDFLKVPGFKEKTATKLYNGIKFQIDKSSLPELMAASNIFGRGFGERRFSSILKIYPDILLSQDKYSPKENIARLVKVDGIASKTAEKFVEKIPEFAEFLKIAKLTDKLYEKDPVDDIKSLDKSHILYGKKIVFTGGKDKTLIDKLKNIGAEISSSVSKNTFVVIAKTNDEDTGKAETARKLDIPIMTKEEFEQKYF